MGKVGSQTINHTLKKIDNLMVFHDHSFSIKQSRERNKNYITDVHALGYNVRLFDGSDLVKNDDDWWDLCEKIGYYGKWIEYVIPHIIEYQRKNLDNLEMITNIFFSNKRKMIKKNYKKILGKKKIKNLNLNLRPSDLKSEIYYKITELYEEK